MHLLTSTFRFIPIGWSIALSVYLFSMPLHAEVPRVLVSIKPIHSLVAGVMQRVGDPELLISAGQSPHLFSLRPSDVRKLSNADIIFWVGENLETSLSHAMAANAGQAEIVELMELPDLTRLPIRQGGVWDTHTHDEESHAPDTHHLGEDHHIWLSPGNAAQIVLKAADILSRSDPEHAHMYRDNASDLLQRLASLDEDLRIQITPVSQIRYIVLHDAYRYFEDHYGLNGVGSVTVSPDETPGVKRMMKLRKKIIDLQTYCVFGEPQFQPKLIHTLLEGSHAKAGILDPIGSSIAPGPDFYFKLMHKLADNLVKCLSGSLSNGSPQSDEFPKP